MKATKVTMPNGKERILIEVKPKEYEAINVAFTNAYIDTQGAAEKEEKRMDALDNAHNASPTDFYDWTHIKESE